MVEQVAETRIEGGERLQLVSERMQEHVGMRGCLSWLLTGSALVADRRLSRAAEKDWLVGERWQGAHLKRRRTARDQEGAERPRAR